MLRISDYVERAIKRMDYVSYTELARDMGVTRQEVYHWRREVAFPPEERMLLLADLAGITPEQALLELSYWKADSEAAKATFEKLIKRFGVTAATLAAGVFLFSHQAHAAGFGIPAPVSGDAWYYILWKIIRVFISGITGL